MQNHQDLRNGSYAYLADAFAHRHVSPLVQSVLDPPGTTQQSKQTFRVGLLGTQARYIVQQLDSRLASIRPLTGLQFRKDRRRAYRPNLIQAVPRVHLPDNHPRGRCSFFAGGKGCRLAHLFLPEYLQVSYVCRQRWLVVIERNNEIAAIPDDPFEDLALAESSVANHDV